MSSPVPGSGTGVKKHVPFVPENMEMKEFTLRAVLLGLLMTVVLGAANAYLGLRAGITIAATYPAAVIAMAAMRAWKGSLLEENIARTAGTIGEGLAAGAIFTIPAFVIAKAWPSFRPADAYWKSTALMMVGSILGVLFISLVRRVMVEDPELPFPESVAAAEIHKAGRRGADSAKYLFWNIGVGGLVYILGRFGLFAADKDIHFAVGSLGRSQVRLGTTGSANVVAAGGTSTFAAPSVSPAYLGVGYIIGLRLASIQFAGGVLAWGLMVPLLIFFWDRRLSIIFLQIRLTIGRRSRSLCGDLSYALSPLVECWWARLTRFSRWGKVLPPASAGPCRICAKPQISEPSSRAPNNT